MALRKKNLFTFFVIAFIYVLVQFKGLMLITPGDENVYFYMAKSLSEGSLPYRDFFYAHPPLHIIILSIIIKVFGVNFFILKSVTLAALVIASFFIYRTSQEIFINKLDKSANYVISILATVFFLFSFEIMFKSTFSIGINFSLMFITISLYMLTKERYFVCGLFSGLAGLTRLYALPVFFAICIFTLVRNLKDKKFRDSLYMLFGFFITFGLTFLFLVLTLGNSFIEPVIKYHFLKPKLPGQRLPIYWNVVKENWVIIVAFISSIFVRGKRNFMHLFLIILSHLFFLLLVNAPAEFYFSILFPPMAIIGSYSIFSLIGTVNNRYAKVIVTVLLASLFIWNTAADLVFLKKLGFLEFQPLQQLVDKVKTADSNKRLFGDDSIVPLLALMADRHIALNYIDSNEKRLTSGVVNFYLLTNNLDDANLSYIILRKNRGMSQIMEMREYVDTRCSFDEEYFDLVDGYFLVYKC